MTNRQITSADPTNTQHRNKKKSKEESDFWYKERANTHTDTNNPEKKKIIKSSQSLSFPPSSSADCRYIYLIDDCHRSWLNCRSIVSYLCRRTQWRVMSSQYNIGSDLSIFFFRLFFLLLGGCDWVIDAIGLDSRWRGSIGNWILLFVCVSIFVSGRLQRWQHLGRQFRLAQLVGRRGSADAAASQTQVAAQSHLLHQRADWKSRKRFGLPPHISNLI